MQQSFSRNLTAWYRQHARDLPWRKTKDPYKIWISEIMLQQTTVNAVIPYYERWIKLFPTVRDAAKAPLQKILKVWQGLGYYQRAKNIHKAAKLLCENYKSKIPSDPFELKKLPGFGPYTVGAVASIAFDKRVPIIDANIRRVVMRLLSIKGHADTTHDVKILKFLDKVMPQKGNNIFNQAMMELGALVCCNREPLCTICPVNNFCAAYKRGIQEIIPTPKKRVIKNINAVIALIKHDGKYFIQKRGSKGLLADLWEFPGGKIEERETPRTALQREIKEELGSEIHSIKEFMQLKHFYTQFRVHLNVFTCQLKNSPKTELTHRWVDGQSLKNYPMPSGSARIVEQILKNP